MAKRILFAWLVTSLLTACLTIRPDETQVTPAPAFITATLPPAKAELLPVTPTALPPINTSAPALTVTLPANCTTSAILLRDVTIPDDTRLQAGETFTKTWEFQNTGTCPWTGYAIRFANGDAMNAPPSTPLSDTPPQGIVQISVPLTAPTADGRYTGHFSLINASGETVPIGTQATFWVRILVGAGSNTTTSTGSGAIATPSGNCTFGGNAAYLSEIVTLINTARANAGLPALTVSDQLSAFAQHHAEDMAYNNFLSHDGSDGSFSARMQNSGFGVFSEILAIGTPQNAIEQWQRDEHWDYVLNPGATLIGAGYAYNSCSNYGGYFTIDFQ